jgi:hypothetical protein
MDDPPDHPSEIWLNPLIRLMNWWGDVDNEGMRSFSDVLAEELIELNCCLFTSWLYGLGHPHRLAPQTCVVRYQGHRTT